MRYQARDYWCGPAALQNALRVFGAKVSQGRIARLAGTTADGTDETGLIAAAEALGFRATEVWAEWKPIETLRSALRWGPVLLCVDEWGHWVTALPAPGARVLVVEPSTEPLSRAENGLLVVHEKTLVRRWGAGRRTRGELESWYGLLIEGR